MISISREKFIDAYLSRIRNKLLKFLPNIDIETNMISKAREIVDRENGHLKSAMDIIKKEG